MTHNQKVSRYWSAWLLFEVLKKQWEFQCLVLKRKDPAKRNWVSYNILRTDICTLKRNLWLSHKYLRNDFSKQIWMLIHQFLYSFKVPTMLFCQMWSLNRHLKRWWQEKFWQRSKFLFMHTKQKLCLQLGLLQWNRVFAHLKMAARTLIANV